MLQEETNTRRHIREEVVRDATLVQMGGGRGGGICCGRLA